MNTTSNPQDNTADSHHYSACTGFGWAVGATRAEAIKLLASAMGAGLIASSLRSHGGMYCWSCKVLAPKLAHYNISAYKPQGVPTTDVMELKLVSIKGHAIPAD